jgi:hypothetical protein
MLPRAPHSITGAPCGIRFQFFFWNFFFILGLSASRHHWCAVWHQVALFFLGLGFFFYYLGSATRHHWCAVWHQVAVITCVIVGN